MILLFSIQLFYTSLLNIQVFNTQLQQQQCNLYFKSNQKLQTTTERKNCSSHICKFYMERITYWVYPILKMIISLQRHSSQILVRTSVKQRSILGLHKLQLHAYLLRPLNDGQYCYCSELCPC